MRRQGRATRMPRQGGLRVGVGGAVQTSRTTQPTQHPRPQPPAAARARRAKPGANAPARQSDANAAPGRITGGGGRGGANKPYHAAHPTPPPPTTRGSTSHSTPPHIARFSSPLDTETCQRQRRCQRQRQRAPPTPPARPSPAHAPPAHQLAQASTAPQTQASSVDCLG